MLEVKEVTGGYEKVTVLQDISLSVQRGEVVALLGPNGAGKTTTLKTISGLLKQREGSVTLDGVDISRLSAAARTRKGICHLIEGRGVFPSLNVRENLILFAPKGKEQAALDRAVSAFPILGQRLRQLAGTMSGGEQQMLALARAYSWQPRIVLVDEASFGLGPLVVDAIFDFLGSLAAMGIALLIVEQYVSRALAMATSVFVIQKGRIVYGGPASDLDEQRLFDLYSGV